MSRTIRTERNPNHGKFIKPDGYKDIGYVNFGTVPELKEHYAKKCKTRHFDNSLYMHRATDCITICDDCKIVFHTDMSD
jgi:hypothetical protein